MLKSNHTQSLANPFTHHQQNPMSLAQSMSGGRRHGGSMLERDTVHVGSQDSKFTQMFNEGMKNFRIRQFAKDRANPNFGLMDPSLLNGKYVVYKVMGEDQNGNFEGNRRYNEFFLLRQVIVANWPGIYIPSTPSKKLVGNKDVRFIIERRYFLERFIL